MNQKSLDKKKTKKLDWEKEFDKNWINPWSRNNFGIPKAHLDIKDFISRILTQQRTELEQQKVKVVWNSVCEQIKKDTIEQILNLECLVDEIPTMSEPEIEVDNKVIRNKLREEIIKEIKKL